MSVIPQSNNRLASDPILDTLRQVGQRQWQVTAIRSVLRAAATCLAVLLAGVMLLGWFPEMPAFLRISLTALAWAGILGAAVRGLRPAMRSWSAEAAANYIERVVPDIQERVSSAVELSSESDPRFQGSPALVAHLVRQAEEDVRTIRADTLVPPTGIVPWACILAPILLVWLALALVKPMQIEAGLYRVLLPWRAHLPAMLSKIAVDPGDIVVAQGDSLRITARTAASLGASGPATLLRNFGTGQNTAQAMDRTSNREFGAKLEIVQEGFSYQVTTQRGNSAWYAVTVQSRPAVAGIDLNYQYPSYTRQVSKTEVGSDGSIDAIVGTKVLVTVHASEPLSGESRIVLDKGTPQESIAALASLGKLDYQATIGVDHTAGYSIELANDRHLTNRDEPLRNILARPDQAPWIEIESPGATAAVRPEDTVPVRYKAGDDFGVSSVQALIQVDDGPVQTSEVKLPAVDERQLQGQFDLSVPAVLAPGEAAAANRISYQFRVNDNRAANPQQALSARQTLIIDRKQQNGYASHVAAEQAKDLQAAISKAIDRLNQSEQKINSVRYSNPKEPLNAQQKLDVDDARQTLNDAARELDETARQAEQTPFADVAHKAEDIAEHPMTKAAEEVARAQLNVDDGAQRKENAIAAATQTAEARRRLEALREDVRKAAEKAEAAQALADAAREQQQAADDMAHKPQQTDQNMQTQQRAAQKLQEAMNHEPKLRDDAGARQTAQKLAELTNRVAEIQKREQEDQKLTEKQQQAEQNRASASKLAAKQEELNQQIEKFAQENRSALKDANASAPKPDEQHRIVDDLNNKNMGQAATAMNHAADQLKQTSEQLQQAGEDHRNHQAAQEAQKHANDAAEALRKSAEQPSVPKANDPAIRKSAQARQAIADQANAMKPHNDQARQALEDAKRDVDQASQDALAAQIAQGPNEAQQDLQQAADDLQKSAEELAQAARLNDQAPQAQAPADQQTAKEAARLSDSQRQLAQQTQPTPPPPADQVARQEKQLNEQTKQTQREAEQLQHQADNAQNQDVANRAAKAREDLKQAADEQNQAADAEKQNQPDDAAKHEQAAQQSLAKAENALRDLEGEPSADSPRKEEPSDQSKDKPPHQAKQSAGKPSKSAQQAQQEATQAAQEAEQAQQQAMAPNAQAAAQAAKALQRAAQAMAQALPGRPEPGQGQADQDQGQGQGQQAKAPGQQAAQSMDSKQGISASGSGGAPEIPKPVQSLGISPREWAKLPPLMQKELLNAAQQNGPPAYRQMIKNYFVKIASEEKP